MPKDNKQPAATPWYAAEPAAVADDPVAAEPVGDQDHPIVIEVDAASGVKHYAWRKDGTRPEVDLAAFAINRHSALPPLGTADFASLTKP